IGDTDAQIVWVQARDKAGAWQVNSVKVLHIDALITFHGRQRYNDVSAPAQFFSFMADDDMVNQNVWPSIGPAKVAEGTTGDIAAISDMGGGPPAHGSANTERTIEPAGYCFPIPAPTGAVARQQHAASYDVERQRIVVAGGSDGASNL